MQRYQKVLLEMMVYSCFSEAHDEQHRHVYSCLLTLSCWNTVNSAKLLLAIMPVSFVMYTFMLLWENLCGVNMTDNFHSVICDHGWIYSSHYLRTWSISTKLQNCFYPPPPPFFPDREMNTFSSVLILPSFPMIGYPYSQTVYSCLLPLLLWGLIKWFHIPWSFVLRTRAQNNDRSPDNVQTMSGQGGYLFGVWVWLSFLTGHISGFQTVN